ncbi:hypothetical protein D3C72_565570 [compost metagenome]
MLRALCAKTAEQGGSQGRVQRRYFEFEGHRPAGAVLPLEMVGVDRLRCPVKRVDDFVEARCGHVHRVQEGTFSQGFMWVRSIRTQQQRRAVDAAAGQHVMPRLDRDFASGRRDATFVHRHALQASDLVAVDQQLLRAGQIKQFAAHFQCRRNGRDHHRLFGIGRTAHAAIAEVPAAAHVTWDHVPAIAQLLAAFTDHVVVGVGWHHPRGDAEALLHFLEPRRHLGRAVTFDVVFLGPVLEGRLRGAKARGPVDQRCAADSAALKNGDRAVLAHAPDAFLIKAAVGLVFEHFEVGAGFQRAFFDQQHFVAGGAEDFCRGAATGAAADDSDVGFKGEVVGQLCAVVGFPASGEAFAERVGYGHRSGSLYYFWMRRCGGRPLWERACSRREDTVSDARRPWITAMRPRLRAGIPGHHHHLLQRAMPHAQ